MSYKLYVYKENNHKRIMSYPNNKLSIGGYLFTEHALKRMSDRKITTEHVLFTLNWPCFNQYPTYNNRISIFNELEGFSVIIERELNHVIVITVTELQWRISKRTNLNNFWNNARYKINYPRPIIT